jgi:hypothetical protein
MGLEFWDTRETAREIRDRTDLCVEPHDLARWAREGRGPCVHRVGGRYFSSRPSRERWIAGVLAGVSEVEPSSASE